MQELGIERLSVGDRLALVQAILDSIAAEQPPALLSESKRRELDRRLADADANPDAGVSWEQVQAAALARFGR